MLPFHITLWRPLHERRQFFPALIAIVSCFAAQACANDAAVTDGIWRSAPSMRNDRAAHAVVSTRTSVYALAGTGTAGRPVLEVERFDGDKWALESTLPGQGLNAPAAVIFEDRIYVIGGFNTSTNIPAGQVHVYNLKTKQWSAAAPLPRPRGGHAAVMLSGKIHVLGGGNSMSTIADHSVYDPASDAWTDLAPLPRAEGSPAAAVLGGRIYAIGGRSGTSDFGDVYIYDPAKDSWTPGPAIEPRGTAGAVKYCGTIFLFGGESQAKNMSLGSVLRLDLKHAAWKPVSAMPTARNFARAVLLGDAVYVVGGSPTPGSSHASSGSAVVERFHTRCPAQPRVE